MRFFDLVLAASCIAVSTGYSIKANYGSPENAGYLAAIFKGDEPTVFFYVASADQPTSFEALNNGTATLMPTSGTGGARDPFILDAQSEGSGYYILATDLDIGKTDWGEAQANGSRSIFVWNSSDGIEWSKEQLVELMPPTAGYVWAPSAIWDVDKSQYALFWSSQVYNEDDVNHTGPSMGPFIYYSHTSDFQTFTEPARWEPDNNATVIDQEIQYLGGKSYARYLSDTAVTKRVILDRSDDGLFGPWTRIGVPVDALREGPASFQDIKNPQRYYLWEDNYTGAGYECSWTENFQVPYQPCEPSLSPSGMRHGGVIQIDSKTFEALSAQL